MCVIFVWGLCVRVYLCVVFIWCVCVCNFYLFIYLIYGHCVCVCSFLLDRLMQYEKVEDSSGDSDATASSDSDVDGHHRDGVPAKR